MESFGMLRSSEEGSPMAAAASVQESKRPKARRRAKKKEADAPVGSAEDIPMALDMAAGADSFDEAAVSAETEAAPAPEPGQLRAEAWRFTIPPGLVDSHSAALSAAEESGSLDGILGADNTDLSLQAAYLFSLQAPPAEGIEALRRVLRINGGHPMLRRQAYARLGDLLAAQGDGEGAGRAYIEALSLD